MEREPIVPLEGGYSMRPYTPFVPKYITFYNFSNILRMRRISLRFGSYHLHTQATDAPQGSASSAYMEWNIRTAVNHFIYHYHPYNSTCQQLVSNNTTES
jgi:hypothetical protein